MGDCQRSYFFFATILLWVKPFGEIFELQLKISICWKMKKICILYSEQSWATEWQEDIPRGGSSVSLPTQRDCLGEEPFKYTQLQWWSLFSRQSDATSVGSHSTFCSNICNPGLLAFCPSTELRAIKAMWVTRMVPSTGVVIMSYVITIITAYDDKKP